MSESGEESEGYSPNSSPATVLSRKRGSEKQIQADPAKRRGSSPPPTPEGSVPPPPPAGIANPTKMFGIGVGPDEGARRSQWWNEWLWTAKADQAREASIKAKLASIEAQKKAADEQSLSNQSVIVLDENGGFIVRIDPPNPSGVYKSLDLLRRLRTGIASTIYKNRTHLIAASAAVGGTVAGHLFGPQIFAAVQAGLAMTGTGAALTGDALSTAGGFLISNADDILTYGIIALSTQGISMHQLEPMIRNMLGMVKVEDKTKVDEVLNQLYDIENIEKGTELVDSAFLQAQGFMGRVFGKTLELITTAGQTIEKVTAESLAGFASRAADQVDAEDIPAGNQSTATQTSVTSVKTNVTAKSITDNLQIVVAEGGLSSDDDMIAALLMSLGGAQDAAVPAPVPAAVGALGAGGGNAAAAAAYAEADPRSTGFSQDPYAMNGGSKRKTKKASKTKKSSKSKKASKTKKGKKSSKKTSRKH